MTVTTDERGHLQFDDAVIINRNFEGREGPYNRAGERNFNIKIEDEELANALIERGWNIKIKPPYNEGDPPRMFLKVKVKFGSYGPKIHLESLGRETILDESTCGCIDNMLIENVDMIDIRPYTWEINGKTGTTAYLQEIWISQRYNRFNERSMRLRQNQDDFE